MIFNLFNGNAFLNIVILYYLPMRRDVWFENHLVSHTNQTWMMKQVGQKHPGLMLQYFSKPNITMRFLFWGFTLFFFFFFFFCPGGMLTQAIKGLTGCLVLLWYEYLKLLLPTRTSTTTIHLSI